MAGTSANLCNQDGLPALPLIATIPDEPLLKPYRFEAEPGGCRLPGSFFDGNLSAMMNLRTAWRVAPCIGMRQARAWCIGSADQARPRWKLRDLTWAWLLLLIVASGSLAGAEVFWDRDGSTAGGSPDTTATGTWGTDAWWSPSAAGTAVTGAWTSGADAVFSAGTDVTGTSTITVSGTQTVRHLRLEEGALTFSGGNLAIASQWRSLSQRSPIGMFARSRFAASRTPFFCISC